jgi:DNA-binding transcriptional MerR regulator
VGTRNYQSIGEVLVAVKTEFPDITISKIRFLESEGLITPERTPSGYRKFYPDDVDRLKSILRMQRDEYLPLKVIKERLLAADAGEELEAAEAAAGEGDEGGEGEGGAPRSAGTKGQAKTAAATVAEELAEPPTGLQMSLEEMSAATGVDRERIKELESFGIVCSHGPEGGRYYDGDDYITLSVVKDFFRFGIEPRHLTMYKHFADRESSFFEALVAPTLRQKNPDARRAAQDTLAELSVTSRRFKQALLRTALREHLS